MSDRTDWVPLSNASGGPVPSCALARVTGVANGLFTVDTPDADGDPHLVAVGFSLVPTGGRGTGTFDPRAVLAYEEADGTPQPGEEWGAGAGTWKLRKGKTGWRILGGAGRGLVNAVRACCGTTTTTTTAAPTTTAGPCAGACQWTYSASSKAWTRTASTCAAGCACLAPTWCPGADACATTACGRLAADAKAPNCTGATTTGGPCPAPADCAEGCDWFCHPVRGWVQTRNGCAGYCGCQPPAGACSSCAPAHTPCVVPPSFCNGGCRWVWVSGVAGESDRWEKIGDTCAGSRVPNCSCDAPAAPGNSCGHEAATRCYVHGAADPCAAVTTSSPAGCGDCIWGSDSGTAWDKVVRPCGNAGGCSCQVPPGAPSGTCAQAAGACVPLPVTTTAAPTTTAGPPTTTTTTTTAQPFSCWQCRYQGFVRFVCTGEPGHPCENYETPTLRSQFPSEVACTNGCGPGGGTTAAPTTTTSTTTPAPTTTTGGPAVDYYCCQCPGGVARCSFDPINQCAGCTVTGPMSLASCNGTCAGAGTTTTPPPPPPPPPPPVTTGLSTSSPF
ncbi:hypothetical protein GobsT_37810 [Gemmata obscuriglobus]|uniref:hypothetical protein n=1 Tax=Gemmata obscuriglobus TaxID=114 RepID=UPI0002E0EC6B|nr:hypothetical protein [Gemmata obscuriglobus]QEG28992.1 hypothetical protein GobsT_37810 [Gemmata obscuriglobus]VTS07559.1 unnamed protein product [Gemmata obscuriglobus UQM 2246]